MSLRRKSNTVRGIRSVFCKRRSGKLRLSASNGREED